MRGPERRCEHTAQFRIHIFDHPDAVKQALAEANMAWRRTHCFVESLQAANKRVDALGFGMMESAIVLHHPKPGWTLTRSAMETGP